MVFPASYFHLKVRQIEQVCLFELSWGEGQTRSVEIALSPNLNQHYQIWRQAYLNYYQSAQMRGRPDISGTITLDWRSLLSEAETQLLNTFQNWLQSAELYEIRAQLANAAQQVEANEAIQVFLTCSPLELDRLPWELWNIQAEFSTQATIRWIRAPLNIAAAAVDQALSLRRRQRVLVVLGDDTGLNFEEDRQAVKSLQPVADVEFVGWQPELTAIQVIEQITQAITDPKGWDVLFFVGHSNETLLTGGELGIAPGISINIQDITPQLMVAKLKGLQVAIFNSCSGLSLAHALIDMGLGQVVVMREPIHNRVAQVFLLGLLQGLGEGLDIYDALQAARQVLQEQKRSIYPSAALVPSLFCHPGAKLFRIQQRSSGFKWDIKSPRSIVPSIVLIGSLLLSVLPPIHEGLLSGRMVSQGLWRDWTNQLPALKPPITLVQIDASSINQAKIKQLHPIDRSYLAKIVDQVIDRRAKVLGVDVVLDQTQPNGDQKLKNSIQRAVKGQAWLVFASVLAEDGASEVGVLPEIASLNWSLQGYTDAATSLVQLPQQHCVKICPISYVMALVQQTQQTFPQDLPKVALDRRQNLRQELFGIVTKRISEPSEGGNRHAHLAFLGDQAIPLGLQVAVDFSIPPDRVYQKIAAKDLADPQNVPDLSQQMVLIGAGCDDRLKFAEQKDCEPVPPAFNYWREGKQPMLTGAELLAYMTYQFSNRRLLLLIPDSWGIFVAVPLGLFSRWAWRRSLISKRRERFGWIIIPLAYGLLGLQLYISIGILLPWLLPSLVYLSYGLRRITEKSDV
jgi:hypothetical protein